MKNRKNGKGLCLCHLICNNGEQLTDKNEKNKKNIYKIGLKRSDLLCMVIELNMQYCGQIL